MNKKEVTVIEMELKVRKDRARDVIRNAKEIVSVGLHGKEIKKIIALVPVSLIKVDHESYQRDEKRHIIKMSKEWDDSQCTMLLVNYRSAEGWFYAIDGQHRTVSANILGIEYLPCEIFVDLSVEEEAKRFLYYNTGTKSLSPFDTFKANICWGEPNDIAIKKVCDKYGVTIIDRKGKQKVLRSVPTVRTIYKNSGTSGLEWIFTLIEDAYWDDFKESYSSDIISGLGDMYQKHIGSLVNMKKNLVEFMRKSNPTEIIGLANSEYPTLGHNTRVKRILEDIATDSKNNTYKNKKVTSISA